MFGNQSGQAQGGMAFLNKFKENHGGETTSNNENFWSDVWGARVGFPYSMPKGSQGQIVFLDDVKVFAATPVLITWVNHNGRNFPKLDFLRSPAYALDGSSTGERCYISEITGLRSKVIGVVPIIDFRPYTDKNGVEHKYSFKHLLVKDMRILQQFQNISEHHNRGLAFSKMKVSRSLEQTSAGCGDSWFCEGFTTEEELNQFAPDWREKLASFNFEAGFPAPDLETAKGVLRKHVAVCEKNKDRDHYAVNYNRDAWAELSGEAVSMDAPAAAAPAANQPASVFPETDVPTPSSPFDGMEDLGQAATSAPAATSGGSDFNLDELDNALNDALG